jgi:predicted transcriptional regulator
MTRKQLTITVNESLGNKIQQIAEEADESTSWTIEKMCNQAIAKSEKNYENIDINSNIGRSMTFWLKEACILMREMNTKLDMINK